MKALELLYQYQQADEIAGGYMSKPIAEAIKELETHITVYQGIRRRLDDIVSNMRSTVEILERMDKEINDLKKENKELQYKLNQ